MQERKAMPKRILRKFKLTRKENHFEHFALVVILILLLCQILLFHSVTEGQNKDMYISEISKSVDRLILEEENNFARTATLAASVVVDEDVVRLISDGTISEIQGISLGQRMRKYVSMMGNVSRVYLYKQSEQSLIDLFEAGNVLSNEHVTEMADVLSGSALVPGGSVVIPLMDDSGSYEYCVYNIYSADRTTDDLILVELRYEQLLKNYDDCQQEIMGSVIVSGDSGKVIYGGTEFKALSDIDDEPFFRGRQPKKSYIGSFRGVRSLIYYGYSTSLDRWYISIVPYSRLRSQSADTRLIFMYISIIIAAFTIFRCYKWFRALRSNISAGMARLSQRSAGNEEKQRRLELAGYLDSKSGGGEQILSILGDAFRSSAVLAVRIDNFDELRNEYTAKDIELLTFGVDNICTELLAGCGLDSYYFGRRGELLYYVVGTGDNTSDGFEQFARTAMVELNSYIGLKTSYYISSYRNKNELKISYQEAKNVLEYFFLYGEGCILDSSVIRENSDISLCNAKLICDKIKESIIRSDNKEKETYDKLVASMKEMSISDIREIMFYLLICLYSATEALREKNAIVTSFDVINSLMFATGVGSFDRFGSFVTEIFDTISAQKSVSGVNRVYAMVRKCYDIIDENYSNEELCITYIAERFGVTDNYLGRRFKEVTGKTIASVITEKRLTEASLLLVETDKSVKEIMLGVGYTNSSYFSAVFKKRYGVTPVQYRQCREKQ